nr:MAG TPA: hypothetical protein [Bacteriophage sp.]
MYYHLLIFLIYKAFKLYHPAKIKSPLFITNQELISQSTI